MRCIRLTIIAIFVCASGLAQTIEPAPSPISNKLDLPATPTAPSGAQRTPIAKLHEIKRGQSEEQVHNLLGPPLAREANHDKHGAPLIIEDWLASDNEKVTVWFKQLRGETEYRVDSIRFWQAETEARAPAPGTASQVVNKVASVVDGFYLAYYCPKVYQRPLIWMTAAEYTLLQQCNENGFMFFGVYFYTGAAK